MRIGINALSLQNPATGSAQYLLHLLAALVAADDQNEYRLLGPQPLKDDSILPAPLPYNVQPVPTFSAKSENIEKLVWEQFSGPAAAHQAGVDLYHVPYFAPPLLPRTPTVVTIHDAIPLRLPAYHEGTRVKAYMRLVARAAHRADMVITVSQHAKQDIMDTMKIPAERIRVIYEAASDACQPVTDSTRLQAARSHYDLGERYIFYLGGLDQRKNVPQLVRAFARVYHQVGDPSLQLLISGNPDKLHGTLFPDPRPVAAELDIADHVVFRFVEDADKAAIYSGAELFVFPSLYEGFGLDPLEAMSCGTPVVCSNRTSLPEVVGDAALTVDPQNIDTLADAMRHVLTNKNLQTALRARSLRQATRFSWHKTASETLAVYEETLARTTTRRKK